MRLPAPVSVGDVVYSIRYAKGDAELELLDGDYGRTFVRRQLILIAPDQGPDQVRDTVVHEVLHAIFAQTALAKLPLPEEDAEEALVRELTPGWVGVLRRNPRFVAWLVAR